jgi:3-dehydroquinate dehydratase
MTFSIDRGLFPLLVSLDRLFSIRNRASGVISGDRRMERGDNHGCKVYSLSREACGRVFRLCLNPTAHYTHESVVYHDSILCCNISEILTVHPSEECDVRKVNRRDMAAQISILSVIGLHHAHYRIEMFSDKLMKLLSLHPID